MTSPPELSNPTEVQQSLLAEYPPLLRSAGIGGKPIVWLLVAEDGRVARARLHSSSGHEALDSAALRVARRMVFRPAEYQGQRVAVWLDIPIVFTVAEGAQGNQDGQAAARPPAGQRPQQVRAQSIQERPLVNADEIRAAVARNYPPLHRDAGVGGEAVIWIYAEADGTPTKTQVARTSGYPALDDVALKLVDRMRFKVQPSAGWIEVPIVFNAQQASQPQAQQQVRAQTVKERPLVNMPMILAALVREYPPLLRDAGIGGEVVLWIYAEADGTPTKSQLGRTSGYPALDEAALKIVGIMRFKAARTGSWIEVPLSWTAR